MASISAATGIRGIIFSFLAAVAVMAAPPIAGAIDAGLQVDGHPVNFGQLVIENSVLLAIGAPMNGTNRLYFGTLDAAGAFTQGAGSPLSLGFVSDISARAAAVIHPVNSRIYVLDEAGAGNIRKSSGAYDALSGSTTFADVALPAAFTNWTEPKQLGIGPDGRLFVGSGKSGNKVIAYSDDDGSNWTEVETGIGGTSGANISTLGEAVGYAVFFGAAASTNKGVAGFWANFPLGGTIETHANDGVVVADPVGLDVIYMTTDNGANWSRLWNIDGNTNGFENGYWWMLLSGSGYSLSCEKFGEPGYAPVGARR